MHNKFLISLEEINRRHLLQEEYLGTKKPVNILEPIVSVRVNTYRHVNYIKKCLDSILMQKISFPYEILIGEDESTDGTREICIEYAEKYPDKIRLFLRDRKLTAIYDEQGTLRKSLNSMFTYKSCRGKYLAACEGDDYWTDSYKLRKQVDILEANPIYSACFHETQQIFEDGKIGKIYGKDAPDILTTEDTFSTLSPLHTSSLVFRNILGELPEWFSNLISGDMALFSILSSSGPLKKIPEIMSVYRKHTEGFTNSSIVTDNFHQKRIELMNYLNEFHNYKFNNKAIKVIEVHKKVISEAKPSYDEISEKDKNLAHTKNDIRWEERKISTFPADSRGHDKFLNISLTPENVDLYYIRTSIKKAIDDNLKNFSGIFLDLGCGEMPYRNYITANSSITKYIGIDIENPQYQKTIKPDMFWDGKKIPLHDNYTDVVFATEVFEHVPDLELVLREINRVLKPNGMLFFTVPFLWPLHDMPYDEYRYTPYSLKRHFSNSGFKDFDIKPMGNWNSGLAQMLGLWLRRAPMNEVDREKLSLQFFPFYETLIRTGESNADFNSTNMFIGISGTVRKEGTIKKNHNNTIPSNKNYIKHSEELESHANNIVLAIVCPQVGAPSETFIRKHIEHLKPGKTVILTGKVMNDEWFDGPVKIIPIQIGKYSFDKKMREEVFQFLKENSVTHILCEFGCIGAPVIELNAATLKLPVFVHFHGQDASEFLLKKDIADYYKKMGQTVDGIITVSKPMRNRLVEVGIQKEKIEIIHYGVVYDPVCKSSPDKTPCRLVAVSRLVGKKGILFVLKAFEKARREVKDITLDLIGEGPLRTEIESFIKVNRLEDNIQLHGERPHSYVLDMMDKSSVLIQHSMVDPETGNREGLPLAILEASSHGLPVISTYHEGIPEAIEHNVSGLLVEEGQWELMSEYIVKLSRNPELRKQMGDAGRKKISTGGFTVEAMIGKLQEFIGLNSFLSADAQQFQNEDSVQPQAKPNFKRILFINHNLYPFENSGTPISTANHALGMNDKGLEVAVLIPSAKVKDGFEKSSEEKYTLYKIPRLDKFAVFLGEIENSVLEKYFSSIEKIIEDFSPEIVQINDYVFIPEKIIALFRNKGIRVVRNVCNLEEICHMDSPVIPKGLIGELCSGPETPRKCAVCFLENHAAKKQDEIDPVLLNEISNRIQRRIESVRKLYSDYVDGAIFTSDAFKNYYTQFVKIDERKILTLPRGINFDFEKVQSKKKYNSDELRFAFIGNMQFVKGPDVLLNAFTEIAFMENFRLDIYGAIVDKAYKGWIKQLEDLYPEKFKYHGSYKKDELTKIAALVDVVIVPSYFDTYNRIVRELLLLGVPMIVTDFFGSSIIQNYVNGIKIGVGDYKVLASEMKKLIDNPSLLANLSSGIANTKIPSLNDEISGMINFYNEIFSDTERINETVHDLKARGIAFYLPQFHPIPENDKWWGKGFTEWTNVAKSQPLFEGHYQPQLPSELGFYDLRLLETQKDQARLAKENGIYGFCYYHYWFNGKRLLETPLTNILKSGEPDFPFCLCWANEDWTRAWDGKSGEILIAQHYSEEDDRQHIQFLSEIFKDKRYIRINGKPLFLVYKASRIPDPLKTTLIWRNEARKLGIGEIYLCRVESFKSEKTDPAVMGFDAAVEFQPDWSELGTPSFKTDNFKVYDYENIVNRMLSKPDPGYKRFPCVTPSWDNTPRRKNNVAILHNSTPEKFKFWMSEVLKKQVPVNKEENFIFINAWNEWGEGAHLEPDTKFGKAYLEAVGQAVLGSSAKHSVSKPESDLPIVEEYKTQASIIIPVWNKVELTKQCIDALLKNTAMGNCEVIIVDNNSTDGTKDFLKDFESKFKIIYNSENLGFSKACNLGAKAASGKYLVFLNNDTVPQKYWLDELINFIDADNSTGIVGCKLLYPDDTIQHCGVSMRYDKKYFRHHYKFLHKDHPLVNEVREYDAVTAACFITQKKLFVELGMFDEEYLNGCEDMDYCTCVREKGYRIYYNPAAVLYHLESQTPRPVNMDDKNFVRYIQKWGADRMQNEIELYAEDGFWQKNGNTYTHQNNPLIGEWLEEVKSATQRLDKEAIEKIRKIVKRIYPLETWTKYEIRKKENMLSVVTQKTNKIKVLFVLHDFPVYRPAGAQLFALSLAKHIDATGKANVEIIYPVFRTSSRKDYSVDKFTFEGITVYELHKEKVNEPGKLFDQKIFDVFDEILKNNKYDLIHIHGLGQLTMAPIFAAEKNSVKMIMTLHDFWFLCDRWHMVRKNQDICSGPESLIKCAQCYIEDNNINDTEKSIEEVNKYKKIRNEIFQGAYSCVNRFYSPSGYLKSIFNKYGFDNIRVLPNGLDCVITDSHRNKNDNSKIIFGYAGQMIIRKGVDFLIEAFKSLRTDKNIELHLYGPLKSDAYSEKIKGMIYNDERIKYFGGYDKKDISDIFNSFDVLVMPSLMDNYPIILQEALANKTPIIASDIGGIPEMVSNMETGILVKPGSADKLAEAMNLVIDNKQLLDKFRNNIPAVKSIDESAIEYLNEYSDVINEKPSEPIKSGNLTLQFYVYKSVHWPMFEELYNYVKKQPQVKEIVFCLPNIPNLIVGGNYGLIDKLLNMGHRCVSHPQDANADVTFIADTISGKVHGCGKIVNVGHGTISKGYYFTESVWTERENWVDLLCVPGDFAAEQFKQILKTRVAPTGMPKLDPVFRGDYSREKLCLDLNLNPDKKIVLYAPTFNIDLSSLYILADDFHLLDKNDFYVLIKLHGSTPNEYIKKYREIANKSKNIKFIEDPNLALYVGGADVMISDVSSAFMEFMALDKPVILFDNPNTKKYHGYDAANIEYAWRDLGTRVRTFEQMLKELKRILINSDDKSEIRKKYAKQLFADLKGNASENVWKETLALLDKTNVDRPVISVVLVLNSDNSIFIRKLIHTIKFYSVMPIEFIFVKSGGKPCDDLIEELRNSGEYYSLKIIEHHNGIDPIIEAIKNSTGGYIGIIDEDVYLYKNFDYIIYKSFLLNPEVKIFTGLTESENPQLNFKNYISADGDTKPDRFAYEFINKYQGKGSKRLLKISAAPPLIFIRRESFDFNAIQSYPEFINGMMKKGEFYVSPSLFYTLRNKNSKNDIIKLWNLRFLLKPEERLNIIKNLMNNSLYPELFELMFEDLIRLKIKNTDLTLIAAKSVSDRFYDYNYKQKLLGVLKDDDLLKPIIKKETEIIRKLNGNRPGMISADKKADIIKVLFYFYKNVHIPILSPVYQFMKQNYPEIKIAFGYMRYAPEIRAGFTEDELEILKGFGEQLYINPQEFEPDITVIADSVYPFVQNCGKIVHVGHGLLSKGQYYTDTELARREESADLVCVPGEYHKKIMNKIITKPVVATGMAKLDDLFSGKLNRKSVLEKYKLPPDYKYILFAPTFNDELSAIPYVMDKINEVIPDDKTLLLVKLHGSTRKEYKEMYRGLFKKDARVIYIDEMDITPFMAVADIMISDVSSAMMEYASLDKPLILFNNLDWKKYQFYNPGDIEFKWRDIGIQVSTIEEMKKAVERSFAHPDEFAQKRKYYTDQILDNKNDGGASKKIIESALSLCAAEFNKELVLTGINR